MCVAKEANAMQMMESLESRSLFSVSVGHGAIDVPPATSEVSAPAATARDTLPRVVGVYTGESRSERGLRRLWVLRITAQTGPNFTGSLTLRNARGEMLGTLEVRGKVGPEGRMLMGAHGAIRIENRELRAHVKIAARIGPMGNLMDGRYEFTAANESGVVHRDAGDVRLIKQIVT
jgi:hypothetical protein